MSSPAPQLVQKLWDCCNILRDDESSCGLAEVERRLSVVEGSGLVVSATLQRATRHRQAILHEAFTGERLTADGADSGATSYVAFQARFC